MSLKEVMNQPVETVSADSSLVGAARFFSMKGVGSLVIVKDGEFVGLLTRSDLVDALAANDGDVADLGVRRYMSSPLRTVDASMGIAEAVDLMQREGVKHLPVVSGGDLVGMVTSTDIVKHCPEYAGELMDFRYRLFKSTG